MSKSRSGPTAREAARVIDTFSEDCAPGTVVGTKTANGAIRRGSDAERRIGIDNGAARFEPVVTPGWGRQGLAYGPFERTPGLVLAVAVTNGHNTSQGGPIPEHIVKRYWQWAVGPHVDPVVTRAIAWAKGPRRKGTLRRLLWWLRSTKRAYRLPLHNENLAVGWFTSESPADPLNDGCGFIVHAALGDNGELWVRAAGRCLAAFRRMQNLQILYVVVLRRRGAVYYAAAMDGAHGLGAIPNMRPIAIDTSNAEEKLYAGIHQCALGQIGFRVDTRVHSVHIERVPELADPFSTAHVFDPLGPAGLAGLGSGWRFLPERPGLAVRDAGKPSGLLHVIVEAGDGPTAAGLAWRVHDAANLWLFQVTCAGCTLHRVENGAGVEVARDAKRRLAPGAVHAVQILDTGEQLGIYIDGERLFDAWLEDMTFADASGVGVLLDPVGGTRMRDFEAHPRQVPIPEGVRFHPPWRRLGSRSCLADAFQGAAGDLSGRAPDVGAGRWERTLGSGHLDLDGAGRARVRASLEKPNPGRTIYTLPWEQPGFADLQVTVTASGERRGQGHRCRCGLVLWQDRDNYVISSIWNEDDYQGSSIALFVKRHGFEELYDAIWTMVSDRIDWGRASRIRLASDGRNFLVLIDGEPVLQRAMADIYPGDPPLRITRVGLVVNWEWGNDTGSSFASFEASA
ncbi:MAG: DNA-binding protein [Hyphomicrobiaceae bacterium]|nr:DNA-binding protein [Hyphomicrobiaceae bacterium]